MLRSVKQKIVVRALLSAQPNVSMHSADEMSSLPNNLRLKANSYTTLEAKACAGEPLRTSSAPLTAEQIELDATKKQPLKAETLGARKPEEISEYRVERPTAPRPDEARQRKKSTKSVSLLRSLFVILVLVSFALCSDGNATQFSMCHNEHTFSRRDLHQYMHEKRQTKDVIGKLFEWCSANAACAEAYHISTQRTRNDEKAFRYISSHWLQMADGSVDLMRPFNETVCENESFDDLLRTLWVIALRLHVKESIRIECGANERAVFDSETMQMHCVCIADRNCVDAVELRESSVNWSNTTVTIACVVLIIVAVQMMMTSIGRRRTYYRLLLECKKQCNAQAEFQKNL